MNLKACLGAGKIIFMEYLTPMYELLRLSAFENERL
jgi:hypothetical protein